MPVYVCGRQLVASLLLQASTFTVKRGTEGAAAARCTMSGHGSMLLVSDGALLLLEGSYSNFWGSCSAFRT